MSTVTSRTSVSLDGCTAGPDQDPENPFGVGGPRLPLWQFETDQPGHEADERVLEAANSGLGAFVMGRKMFGGGDGPWDESWRGW